MSISDPTLEPLEAELDTFEQEDDYWARVPEWIIYHPDLSDGAVRLYGVLARLAFKDRLWRSQTWLAEHIGKSERTVRAYIAELRTVGALTNERRTFNGPTHWTLRRKRPAENSRTVRQDLAAQSGKKQPPNPEPNIQSQNTEPSERPPLVRGSDLPAKDHSTDETFEEIWKLYPRKVDKADARAKFRARVKAGVDPETLREAVVRYRKECQVEQREAKFILHGATFFGPNEKWKRYVEQQPEPEEAAPDYGDDEYAMSEAEQLGALLRTDDARKWSGH